MSHDGCTNYDCRKNKNWTGITKDYDNDEINLAVIIYEKIHDIECDTYMQ